MKDGHRTIRLGADIIELEVVNKKIVKATVITISFNNVRVPRERWHADAA